MKPDQRPDLQPGFRLATFFERGQILAHFCRGDLGQRLRPLAVSSVAVTRNTTVSGTTVTSISSCRLVTSSLTSARLATALRTC